MHKLSNNDIVATGDSYKDREEWEDEEEEEEEKYGEDEDMEGNEL